MLDLPAAGGVARRPSRRRSLREPCGAARYNAERFSMALRGGDPDRAAREQARGVVDRSQQDDGPGPSISNVSTCGARPRLPQRCRGAGGSRTLAFDPVARFDFAVLLRAGPDVAMLDPGLLDRSAGRPGRTRCRSRSASGGWGGGRRPGLPGRAPVRRPRAPLPIPRRLHPPRRPLEPAARRRHARYRHLSHQRRAHRHAPPARVAPTLLLHVLPRGFVKIRHAGLFAPRRVATALPVVQRPRPIPAPPSWLALVQRLTEIDLTVYPHCHRHTLTRQLVPRQAESAPSMSRRTRPPARVSPVADHPLGRCGAPGRGHTPLAGHHAPTRSTPSLPDTRDTPCATRPSAPAQPQPAPRPAHGARTSFPMGRAAPPLRGSAQHRFAATSRICPSGPRPGQATRSVAANHLFGSSPFAKRAFMAPMKTVCRGGSATSRSVVLYGAPLVESPAS